MNNFVNRGDILYDSHVHSSFSGDCKYTMEDMVKSALNKKLKVITFTEHIDYEYGDTGVNIVYTPSDYFKEINRLKNKYNKQIEILSGTEIGMQPHLSEKYSVFLQDKPFDFILLSVHTINKQALNKESYYINKNSKDIIEDYYINLLEIIKRFDNFDVIAHMDLIKKYSNNFYEHSQSDEYLEIVIEILKKIIYMGKGLEINTSSVNHCVNNFYPSKNILQLYKQFGGDIITIGSDAHNPKDICNHYREAISILRDLDFKYISVYKNRRKQLIKI